MALVTQPWSVTAICEDQLSQAQAQQSGPADMEMSALSPAKTTPGDSAAFGLENLAQVKSQLPVPSLLFQVFFLISSSSS